jgi:hypothetical protein
MNPRVFHVHRIEDAQRVVQEIGWRLKVAGPVSVLLAKIGEEDEHAQWQRRYRKLVALISEQVQVGGRLYSPRVWDAELKGRFLIPEEIELPGGRIYSQAPSTKRMAREARDEYLGQVREFASEQGIFLQHPETEGA